MYLVVLTDNRCVYIYSMADYSSKNVWLSNCWNFASAQILHVLCFWGGVVYKTKVDFFLKCLNRILFLNFRGNDNRLGFFSPFVFDVVE